MRTATLHHTLIAGRYAMLDQIGAGGMGSVWRARDERSGDLVAVKVLGHHNAALLIRFVREQAFFVYFGVDLGSVNFANSDYLLRSAGTVIRRHPNSAGRRSGHCCGGVSGGRRGARYQRRFDGAVQCGGGRRGAACQLEASRFPVALLRGRCPPVCKCRTLGL